MAEETLIVRTKINICDGNASWDAGTVFRINRDWALKEIKLGNLEQVDDDALAKFEKDKAKKEAQASAK